MKKKNEKGSVRKKKKDDERQITLVIEHLLFD